MERRISALEDEVEVEKRVSRHILRETRQNGGDLAAIKAQLIHLAGDLVVANAALNSHGTRLNILTRDVREIRASMGEIRAELTQAYTEMTEMRAEIDRRFDAVEHGMALILAAVAPCTP